MRINRETHFMNVAAERVGTAISIHYDVDDCAPVEYLARAFGHVTAACRAIEEYYAFLERRSRARASVIDLGNPLDEPELAQEARG